MSATIPMKVKAYLASLTEQGNLPPVELVRMMQHDEHSYLCRVKNMETEEIFPMSIYVKGFIVAQDVVDLQQLAELDAEERWQKAWRELDVNAVPRKTIRNPFIGKDIYYLEPLAREENGAATPTSPDIIQGRKLAKGDYITFRTGEPTSANPDARPLPVRPPEKKHIRGYIGKVIRFTDTRIVVQTIGEKALYYVRSGDVTTIAKKKEKAERKA